MTSFRNSPDPEEVAERQGVKSVEVAARILQALLSQRIGVSLTDLSRATRIPAAKLHRYLTSLARARLVTQEPKNRQYRLGSFAIELGAAAMHSSDAMLEAVDKLRALRDAVDETVVLAIWSAHGPIVTHVQESSRSVLMTVRAGTMLPITATAAGMVFAAFLPAHLTSRLVAAELEHGPEDIGPIVSSLAELERVSAEIRRQKYMVNKGHLLPGVLAMASPLLDQMGQVVGVLSVVGRQPNFPDEREQATVEALLRIAGHRP